MTAISFPSVPCHVLYSCRSVTQQATEREGSLKMTVMRFRWKRGRIRGKQLLCYICLGVLIVVICRAIGKNVAQFERDWTCEELRARERLTQLVSKAFEIIFVAFMQTLDIQQNCGRSEKSVQESGNTNFSWCS